MPDNTLNITVTTDSSQLRELIAALNAGTLTQAKYNQTVRDLRAASTVGSQAAMDLKNVVAQVSEQTLTYQGQIMKSYFSTGEALRTQEAGERGLTDTIRASRQEHRLYTFAIRESMAAVTGITGTNSAFTQSISQGTSAVFGIKFALDALGGTISRFALPLALAVGAFTILKSLLTDGKKEADEFNKSMKKMCDDIIDNLQKMGRVTLQQIINLRELELVGIEAEQTRLEKEAQKRTPSLKFFTSTGSGLAERFSILKLIYKQDAEAGKALETVYAARAAKEAQIFELKKKQTDEIDKQTKAEEKQNTDRQKALDQQQKAFEQSQQAAWTQAEWFRVAINALNPRKGKNPIPSLGGFGTLEDAQKNAEMGSVFSKQFEAGEKDAEKFNKVLDTGISHSTNLLAEGFAKAFGLGNSLADQLLKQMLAIAAQMAETYALTTIAMALTAGATGNIFTALGAMLFDDGGWVNEPVVGRGMKSGRPYGIAMNGVPEHISTVNQMSQSGRGGGGVVVHNAIYANIDKGGISILTKQGDQMNAKRLL